MARIGELSTSPAGGTPWKGRLRSHHKTPQSSPPQRPPSRARCRGAVEEAQTPKNRGEPKITRRGGSRDEDVPGAARPPRAPSRRSPRLAGRDPEYPIVVGRAAKECKGRDDQSSIKLLRRSPRFHKEKKNSVRPLMSPDPQKIAHNRKTRNASRKYRNQGNVRRSQRNASANSLSRTEMPQGNMRNQTSQDIPLPPQQENAGVSLKKSEEKELEANQSEVLTRKRKRGTEGMSLSVRKGYQKPQSMLPDCQEAAPSNDTRKVTGKKGRNDASLFLQPNIGDMKPMNVKDNNQEPSGIEREGKENLCGQDDWTEEQEIALRQAYFTARPSPHFWKKVSKMVPGRSAEECFNRIYADLSTPTPIAPRPRGKAKFSPIGNFSLGDPELANILQPTVGRQRTCKQRNLAAHKTLRHLLQKHSLIDQDQGADHFSLFESSPNALQLSISFEDSPGTGTPRSSVNSDSLRKSSTSSSMLKKPFSRLRIKQDEPSPAVLKPVKNPILHEKYMNKLFRREGAKRPRRRTAGSKAANNMKAHSDQQAGSLKAAKNALISEATDFIGRFRELQANSLANVVEESEDDETDNIESDTGDC